MAVRAQLKLLLFLTVLGITSGTFALVFWAYKNVLSHDSQIAKEIMTMKSTGKPPPDPGAHHFNEAAELLRAGKLDEGREALYKLLRQFPRSPTTVEAKRIIGEMNLDALYQLDTSSGKRDVIVQPGDSLSAIATKYHTTLEALARVNGLTSVNLQPGDHLFTIPMNFDLVVDTSAHTLTIMREERFFKEYSSLEIKLPPNFKIPTTLEVGVKSALSRVDGKATNPVTAAYLTAEKRVILQYEGSTAAALIIAPPFIVKALPVNGTVAQSKPDSDDDAPPTTGLFLAHEELEELYPLLRRFSKVTLVQ